MSSLTKTGQPTINDVASLSGVSKKTVSRVINRETGLKSETRAKVEQAIADLGWDYPTSRQSKGVDPRCARTSKVQEEWANLVRLVGGGEEGDGKLAGTEICDDNNVSKGDGCSPACHPCGVCQLKRIFWLF